MNALVNTISGRLSLRPPQREALARLARIVEIAPPIKTADPVATLEVIRSEPIPHDAVEANRTVAGLAAQFEVPAQS